MEESFMNGILHRPNLPSGIRLIGWVLAMGFILGTFDQAGAFAPGQDEDSQGYFKGRLGHYPIELYIDQQNNSLNGSYIQRFKLRQRTIELSGYIDPQGQVHLSGKGIFTGRIEGDTFEGVWFRSEDSREKYPFTLSRKDADYYAESYWQEKNLETGGKLDIPGNASIKSLSADSLFSDRWAGMHPLNLDAYPLKGSYRIQLPVEDSSIVSGFNLQLGIYADADSLKQMLKNDSSHVCKVRELQLHDKKVELISYEEGTSSGSHHSNFYFYSLPERKEAYLFHLFYSYTNPWIYGNPYSKEDYQGPYINDMNRLIEIVEMIVTSG
jgi:hypothetical protein